MGNKLETRKKKFIAASVATAVVASATVTVASASTAPAATEEKAFTDVSPNFFAFEEIMGLSKAGIIAGYADGSFKPYQTITRGQTAIMLAKALDLPAAPKARQFTDISQNSPYYNAVSAVVQAGIIKGYGDDFRPHATLTREEMATIMVRAFHLSEKTEVKVPFTDLNSISPTHRKNVEILYQNGLTMGKSETTYAPKESVTRVQFSMFLYRQLKDSLQKEEPPVVVTPPADNSPVILPTEKIDTNIFEGLKEYNKNYVINPSEEKVFGAENPGNNALVKGNLTVKGTLELKNLTIKGTLILDPGDNGEVTLTNVDAAKIEILSGETGTIKFTGVNSPQTVVKDQNGIKLETDGSSTLGNMELAPGNGSEVQLAGNFNDTNIIITKGTTLTAKNDFMAQSLEINVPDPNAEVNLNADAPTDLPAITVSSGVNLKSLSENISTPLINVNVQQPNQTVQLNGPLGKPEVIVNQPATLSVNTLLSKVTANANLSLEGTEAASIESLEAGQNVSITSSDAATQQALDAKKAESITLAKAKIEELKNQANPSLQGIQDADALVKTAMSLGAVKADFQSGEVNLFDVLEAMKVSAAEKLAAINTLKQKLSALPKPEMLRSYTTFSITRLETAIKAAKAAEQAAIAAGVDPATVSNYERLAAAEARVQELKTELQQVKSAAITALQALPEASSIKAENLEDAKKALAEATAAVSAAKQKGVKDSEFVVNNINLLSRLAEVSNAIKKAEADYEAAKKAAIQDAISKVALIPAKDQITVETLGSVRPLVNTARTAVNAALKIGAAEKDITNLSLLTDAEAKITTLDESRTTAITAANTALAQLPEPDSITSATLQDAKTKLKAAEDAVADAKTKGATDNDFTGLEKITAVKEKIAELETAKQTAISEAITALKEIPSAADITATNFKAIKEKVADAKAKVAKAKELGASDSELTGIEKIAAAEAKIAELEKALTEAISAANAALAQLPEPDSITSATLQDAKTKLKAAEDAVADAKAKGASDSDFTGLEKITAVKEKIAALETAKQTAISEAITALNEIPASADITAANFRTIKEKVADAKAKVAKAKELGAADSELTGIEKIAAAEAKIAGLEKAQTEAITAANAAIAQLPEAASITMSNIDDAKARLQAAETAVAEAKANGASDSDFTGLEKITAVKDRITSLEKGKQAAIQDAVAALSQVPAADDITVANFKSVKAKVVFAREKVAVAMELGAKNTDLTGLEKLAPAEAKITQLEEALSAAITTANEKLSEIPAADEITLENIAAVQAKIDAAKAAVQAAKQSGATDSDFTGLNKIQEAEAKIAQLQNDKTEAVKAANDALAEVPVADTITIENYKSAQEKIKAAEEAVAAARAKGATDADFTNLNRIEEAKTKITALLKALTDAIKAANSALAAIPAADSITIQNYQSTQEKIAAAEAAVADARTKGAVDADFTGLNKIDAAKTKIDALLKALADSIAAANIALAEIPAADTITIQNYKAAEEKIKLAEEAVAAARTAGAVDSDFTGLEKIAETKAHIAQLIKDLTEAIAAANTALAAIPAADAITIQNYKSANEKIAAAEAAIADAKAKGAVDNDFKGLDTLEAAKTKVAALLKALADAIAAANTALSAVPDPADITFENYKDAETKIASAEAAVEAAKAKGATESDFTGLTRIEAAKAKIEALLKERADAIEAANTALEAVPAADSITFENYKEAEAKIAAAETAVAGARAKAATDADFKGLTKLSEAKAKVEALKKELADAITAANTALAAIPAADTITIQNYKEAEARITAAEQAIEAAKAKGAVDADFTGLNMIEAAKTKMAALLKALTDAITAANLAIQALPDPSSITTVSIDDAIAKVDAAKKAVEAAKAKGATDADFPNLDKITAVEAKIKEFGDLKAAAIQAANEALAMVPEADSITAETVMEARSKVQRAELKVAEAKTKGAVDTDFVGLDKLAAAIEKLKEFEGQYGLPNWDSPLDALKTLNANIESLTVEVFEDTIVHGYVRGQFEQYKSALIEAKTVKGGDLTLFDIEEIVLNLNMTLEAEGLQLLNENPAAFGIEDLEKVMPWFTPDNFSLDLNIVKERIAVLKGQKGTVYFSDLDSVIEGMRSEQALVDLEQQKENLSSESLYYIVEPYGVYPEGNLLEAYKAKMKQHLDSNGALTPEVIAQIVKQTNEAAYSSALDKLKNNPSALNISDLQILGLYRIDGYLLNHYRDALMKKKSEISGELTLYIAGEVINQVNRQAYLDDINAGGDYYYSLYNLMAHQFDFTSLAEYIAAVEEALAKGPLTYTSLLDLVEKVNANKQNQLLAYVNEHPQDVTIAQLKALNLGVYVEASFLEQYRNAIEEAINLKKGHLTAEELSLAIYDVNEEAALDAMNVDPYSISINLIGNLRTGTIHYILWDQYLEALQAEVDANRTITKASLNAVFDRVNEEAKEEYLARIIADPGELTFDTILIAFPNKWVEYYLLEDYRQAIIELKQTSTVPLTRADIEQLIYDINVADREKLEQEVLEQLNENPGLLTWEQLNQLSFYMEERLFEQYKNKFITLHGQGVQFTFQIVMEVVQSVHVDYALSKINSDPESIVIWDLQLISYEAREANLQQYITALKNAQLPLTIDEVITIIRDVNHAIALKKVTEAPLTLTLNDLETLYGPVARYENYDAYKAEIKLAIEAGETLTVDSLKQILIKVNNSVIDNALKDINDNPLTFAFKSLEIVIDFGVNESWLDYYHEAVNAERSNGELSVQELEEIIRNVHRNIDELEKQQALEYILNNPETFTASHLEQAGFWEAANKYGSYINHFRAAIKKKVDTDGNNLTFFDVERLLWEVIWKFQQQLQEAALDKINNDLTNVTIKDLQNLSSNLAREQYFNDYISKFELLLADGPVEMYEAYEAMRKVNQQGALSVINSGGQLNYLLLSDVFYYADFYSYYEEYLTNYHVAFAKEIAANGPLAVEKLIELITMVNEENGLANILANPDTFTPADLAAVIGSEYYGEYFDQYQAAISEYIHLNGTITADELKQLVSERTEQLMLENIQQNPLAADIYDIKYLLNDKDWTTVRYQGLDRYRQAIAEFVDSLSEGEQLTVADLRAIVAAVNDDLDQEKLDLINKNQAGFERWDLYEVFSYFDMDVELWADIEFYRTAVQEMHADQGELTISDLVEAINKAHASAEQALLDGINNNLEGFDYYDLDDLLDHYEPDVEVTYAFLEFYRSAIQEKYDLDGPLTIDEIVEAVNKGNAAGEQSLFDAINLYPDSFDSNDLNNLFSYFNVNLYADWTYTERYHTAVKEMQEKLKRSDLTLEEIIEAVKKGNAAGMQAELDIINDNLDGFNSSDLESVIDYNLLYEEGVQYNEDDLEFYRKAIIKKHNDLSRDLTAEEITRAVIQGNKDAIQDALDYINQDGSEFTSYHLYKVLGPIEEIEPDNLAHYRKAVEDMRNQLKHDLSAEELLQAVLKGNELAANDYLSRINNDPDNLSSGEFQIFVGNDVKVIGSRMQMYMDEIQAQKQTLGRDLTKAEIIAAVEAVNEQLLSDLVDTVNNNPEAMTVEILHDLSLVYETWWDGRFRMYQIEFIKHKANGGAELSIDEIVQMIREIDYTGVYMYAFIDPDQTYQVGDMVDVEITETYSTTVYLVPKTESDMTLDELEAQVESGFGLKLYQEDYAQFVQFDTSELQAGEYVAYAVNSDGWVSASSNTLTLEAGAQQPQDPTQPEDPTEDPAQPENPPGATIATMDIAYNSGQEVEVSVTDADQNLDAEAVDTIEVSVESEFGDITITLFETGVDSGVFTGKFTFGDNIDEENDIIYEEPNQIVRVSYIDNEDEDHPLFKEVTYQP